MTAWLSKLIDRASEFFAHRKGLLPLIGLALIVLNFVLQIALYPNWVTVTNLFLHLGLIIAILGLMLAWAL
ncbi:MAG: hypothetical protein ACOYZ8_09190 [Chloroflexota bacterium]